MTEPPEAIAYDRVGSGPALVMLHPLGADRHVWAPIVERLAHERELVTVDLPGFGESPPLRGERPTARALAGAVATLIASLEIERPHVTGNSLGGWVALELGLRGVTRSTSAIAAAGMWRQPLVPKPSVAHWLARSFRPLVGSVAASAMISAGLRSTNSWDVSRPASLTTRTGRRRTARRTHLSTPTQNPPGLKPTGGRGRNSPSRGHARPARPQAHPARGPAATTER